ncbi:hypothetical protein ACJJTC_016959 [Scirpophaga incertulas]
MEILKDTSLSSREECARAAAVIRWVVQQTCASACGSVALARDLLVLGVPRAHAAALAEAADAHREAYDAAVRANGFMITDVTAGPGPDGAVDTIKLSLFTDDVLAGEQKKTELLIHKDEAKSMLEELKKVYQKMEELDSVKS